MLRGDFAAPSIVSEVGDEEICLKTPDFEKDTLVSLGGDRILAINRIQGDSELWDFGSGERTQQEKMSHSHERGAFALVGTAVVAAGDKQGSTAAEIFQGGSWRDGAHLPFSRFDSALVPISPTQVLLIAGRDLSGTALAATLLYDLERDEWDADPYPDLPDPQKTVECAVVPTFRDKRSVLCFNFFKDVEMYWLKLETAEWQVLANQDGLPNMINSNIFVVVNKLFLLRKEVVVYSLDSEEWEERPGLERARLVYKLAPLDLVYLQRN